MANVPHPPTRYTPSSERAKPAEPNYPQAEVTEPKVSKLYGPRGEVLRTWSDRPPVGFHQGERGQG